MSVKILLHETEQIKNDPGCKNEEIICSYYVLVPELNSNNKVLLYWIISIVGNNKEVFRNTILQFLQIYFYRLYIYPASALEHGFQWRFFVLILCLK